MSERDDAQGEQDVPSCNISLDVADVHTLKQRERDSNTQPHTEPRSDPLCRQRVRSSRLLPKHPLPHTRSGNIVAPFP